MTKPNQHISILGCGWLGLELGTYLVKNAFNVKGSTTSANKLDIISSHGIQPYLIDLNELNTDQLTNFIATEVLIFNIPPSKIDIKNLETFIETVNQSNLKSVVLISSIGIYADSNSLINEENGTAFLSKTSLPYLIENTFKSSCKKGLTILQLGGLIGENRLPIQFASSKKVLSNPNGRINFIHRSDVIQIIEKVILETAFKGG